MELLDFNQQPAVEKTEISEWIHCSITTLRDLMNTKQQIARSKIRN